MKPFYVKVTLGKCNICKETYALIEDIGTCHKGHANMEVDYDLDVWADERTILAIIERAVSNGEL